MTATPRYWNPYTAGLALGVVLLTTFVLIGRGLGASGAFVRVVAAGAHEVAPRHADANRIYRNAGDESGAPLDKWLVVEIAGVMVGGGVSAKLAGRWKRTTERGPGISNRRRLAVAFADGSVMAIGARLARGCTSGQALSGGAVLAAGSWAFMLALFAGAYLTMTLARRQWQ